MSDIIPVFLCLSGPEGMIFRAVAYMKRLFILFLACFARTATAQIADTTQLEQVSVTAYIHHQPLWRTPAAATVISARQMEQQQGTSLVSTLNQAPGVRMEERSPGSYRLSLRGSLLRSPFGIRNVKVYLDELPLTDAGGNTYLNALGLEGFTQLEVLKGPDGSLFGANSGGVLLMRTGYTDSAYRVQGGLEFGSYGLFRQFINTGQTLGKHRFQLNESFQRSIGYRDNSDMNRFYVQLSDQWQYSSFGSLSFSGFYSDLSYQTPGGLTLEQYEANPQQVRPAGATTPGAAEQKAAVYNKLLFGGITHRAQISSALSHVLSVFASGSDFRNPFITNYETRQENTYGFRSYLDYQGLVTPRFNWEDNLGVEWQQTNSDIHNYDNNGGIKGDLQAQNTIDSRQYFFFNRFRATAFQRLNIEAALSLNFYGYQFRDSSGAQRNFEPQWMPRLALSWQQNRHLVLRASVSRGYSPPTTAEVRPSNNEIYTNLQPESGWNTEAGFRLRLFRQKLFMDAAVYHYELQNAIVRQLDNNSAEYFVNAGGTSQTGIESQISWQALARNSGVLRLLEIGNSTTFSDFYFSNYSSAGNDYSGNELTGVPRQVFVSHIHCIFTQGLYLYAQHNYTARLPLNDANTAYATAYHLVQLKAGWKSRIRNLSAFECYVGIDNLLNQHYSLGNDLNAAGNRFYNAAPLRNYYAGIKVKL